MSELTIGAGLAKRDASGQLLPAGVTGPEILNFKNTVGNITSVAKGILPNDQTIRGKTRGSGSLKYPLEEANPAYQARVSFRMYSLQAKTPGDTQKILDKQTEDNLRNQGVTAAHSEDATFANMGKKVGPTTVASAAEAAEEENNIAGGASNPLNNLDKSLKAKLSDAKIAKTISSSIKGGYSFKPVKSAPVVDMYFPLSMTFADNAQYDNANLNAMGASVEASVAAGAGMLESTISSLSSSAESIFDLVRNNNNLTEPAGRLAAARLINLTPNEGLRNALTLTNRAIINPNTRALFRGVALREFTFQFKMIAESPQEAATVKEIIKHFRSELYPGTYSIPVGRGGVEADIGYKFPNVFQIVFNYKGGRNDNLPRLHHCYLRSVNHTVNPTGGGFRRDGAPNEVDLTLSFVEYKTLNKKDIDEGY